MNAKQFAWLYLVENGVAGCKHNYYGGWDFMPGVIQRYRPRKGRYSSIDQVDLKAKMLAEAREVGVDWKRTADVQSDSVSEFTDTFHDPSTREILCGTLVLLDGTQQSWVADAVEVTNVFEMMAQVHAASERFEKVFGKI